MSFFRTVVLPSTETKPLRIKVHAMHGGLRYAPRTYSCHHEKLDPWCGVALHAEALRLYLAEIRERYDREIPWALGKYYFTDDHNAPRTTMYWMWECCGAITVKEETACQL